MTRGLKGLSDEWSADLPLVLRTSYAYQAVQMFSVIHTDGIRESNYDGPLIEKSYAENVVVPREGRIANSDELRFLHPCAARFCCGESAS